MLRVRIKQRSLHENGCFCLWRLFKIFATIWPLCFALSSDLNSDLRNRIEQTLSKMWANFLKVIERGVKQNSSWKKFQFYNNINLYVSTLVLESTAKWIIDIGIHGNDTTNMCSLSTIQLCFWTYMTWEKIAIKSRAILRGASVTRDIHYLSVK